MSYRPASACCCAEFTPHPSHSDHCSICCHSIRDHPPRALAHPSHHCGDCRLPSKDGLADTYVRHSDSLSRFVRLLQGAKEFTRKLPLTQAENLLASKQSTVWSQRTRSTACESSPGATLTTQSFSSPASSCSIRRLLPDTHEKPRKPLFSPESKRISPGIDIGKLSARSKSARLIRIPARSPQSRSTDSIMPALPLGRLRTHSKEVASEYFPGMSVSRQPTPRLVTYEDELLRLQALGVGHKGGVNDVEMIEGTLWSVGADYCLCKWEVPKESSDPYFARSQAIGRVMGPSQRLRVHKGPINCIRTIGSSGKFCTSACDGLLKIWSGSTQVSSIKSPQEIIQSVAVSTCLIGGTRSGHILKWDISTLQLIAPVLLQEHRRRVREVRAFNPLTFLSASEDRSVKLWDLRTQRSIASFSGHPSSVTSVLPNLDIGFFSSSDCQVWKWDIRVDKVVESWTLPCQVQSLSLMKGRLVAGGDCIHMWQRDNVPCQSHFHQGTIRTLRYFPDLLVSCSWDGCMGVWKVRS